MTSVFRVWPTTDPSRVVIDQAPPHAMGTYSLGYIQPDFPLCVPRGEALEILTRTTCEGLGTIAEADGHTRWWYPPGSEEPYRDDPERRAAERALHYERTTAEALRAATVPVLSAAQARYRASGPRHADDSSDGASLARLERAHTLSVLIPRAIRARRIALGLGPEVGVEAGWTLGVYPDLPAVVEWDTEVVRSWGGAP